MRVLLSTWVSKFHFSASANHARPGSVTADLTVFWSTFHVFSNSLIGTSCHIGDDAAATRVVTERLRR
jgi:hypothetical protein